MTPRLQPYDIFLSYLHVTGKSMTRQRRVILDAIAGMDRHFSTEELVENLNCRKMHVSRATVYRTVCELERAALVRKIDFDHAHAHYESTALSPHHEHMICRECGRIEEFSDTPLERRIETAARERGFELEKHSVQIIGVCKECRGEQRN